LYQLTTFTIGVFNEQDRSFIAELNKLNNVQRKGIPITVKILNNLSSIKTVQLLYLGETNNKSISQAYRAVGQQPTLIVTKSHTNKRLVMINLFLESNKLRFEVNKANIINQKLTPLPALILNGGTEIDVAKLYKEGQQSLVKLQKNLQRKEQALSKLSQSIYKQEAENNALLKKLKEINNSIQKSNQKITEQKTEIEQQQVKIKDSQLQREALLNEVNKRNQELNLQEQRLRERKRTLDTISQNISRKEAEVIELSKTINLQKENIISQKQRITTQQDKISTLDEQVTSQQVTLNYLWVAFSFGTLLFITILGAYIVNRRYNKRLQIQTHKLQIARDRLAIAKNKADKANESKSAFLSIMSHELRSPLQAIIGYTDVSIEELELEGNTNHKEDLSRVIINAQRLLRLINRILDLTKIESGKMTLDLHYMNLSSVIDESISTIKPLVEKNGNQIILDIDDGESAPLIDHEKILHVLINLLANAAKFTHDGEITVRAAHKPELITFEVIDTGIGLSEEEQQRVFERFHQADHGSSRKFQGSGLGLSITQQFCELMGGTIDIKSKKDVGTAFIMNFPLPMTMPDTEIDNEIESGINSGIYNEMNNTADSEATKDCA